MPPNIAGEALKVGVEAIERAWNIARQIHDPDRTIEKMQAEYQKNSSEFCRQCRLRAG